MKVKKSSRILFSTLTVIVVLVFLSLTVSNSRLDAKDSFAKNNLLRLHIIANSNSIQDQELKLKVRDAILKASHEVFQGIANKEEAKEIIRLNWKEIEAVASETIKNAGYNYPITLEIGTFEFPTRSYGNFVLPGGDYEALRVIIGEGKGENWWCVLFPPLCFSTLTLEDAEVENLVARKFDDEEEGTIEFRLKFLDDFKESEQGKKVVSWWQRSIKLVNSVSLRFFGSK
ncbi:MAG: stage II sporulation protein R [Firmicutes bacterium]|nr:stage II sporulation protein R [Bacillota bacterium]